MDRPGRGWALAGSLFAALAALAIAGPVSAQAPADESMSQATTQEHDMDDERARASFRLGRQHYEQGRFAEAGAEFERAFGLSGRTQLLFNAYLAYRDARDDENAIRTLRGYLTGVEDVPDREHLEARLASMEAGLRAQRERDAQAQAQTEEALRAAEDAERRAAEASRPNVREIPGETWPWIVAGAGGALLIAGAITGGVAMAERGDLDAQCPIQLCPAGFDVAGRQSHIESLAITTDVLLITGGVVAVTGVVLGLVLGPRTEVIEPPVSAGCTSTGCFGMVRGEF